MSDLTTTGMQMLPASPFNHKVKAMFGLFGLALLFIAIAGLIVDRLYNPNHFNITKISLSGEASHVDRSVLKSTVVDMIDGNYFSLDTHKIIQAVQALPWIESVRLRRQWPDTLMLDVEEHQPIALWGKQRWLTTSGKLVDLPLPKAVVLPKLEGPSKLVDTIWTKHQHWSWQFARQGIRIQSMELSKQHIYTLKLEYTTKGISKAKGFEMSLANINADQQIETFLSAYRQGLIEHSEEIKSVDLRYPHGFSLSRYEPETLAKMTNDDG